MNTEEGRGIRVFHWEGHSPPEAGLNWTVDAPDEATALLVARTLSSWREIFQEPRGEITKSNRLRTVLRFDPRCLSGEPVPFSWKTRWILKQYRHGDRPDRLRHRFFKSRAAKEWEGLRRLRELGLPAPRPLAFGERRAGGVPVEGGLVMEEVSGAVPLIEKLRAMLSRGNVEDLPQPAAELLSRTGSLVRELHKRGVDQVDLHGSNLLVAPDGSIAVIDLHSTRFRRRLGWRRRKAGLAKLFHSLQGTVPEAGNRQVLAAYLGRRPDPHAPDVAPANLDLAVLERTLEKLVARIEKRRLRSRSRRCAIPSTGFAVERGRGMRLFRRREVPREHLDLLFADLPGSPIKAGPWGWVKQAEVGGQQYLVKRRFYSAREGIRSLLEGHRLYRAYRAGYALEVRGIPTPRVLALREDRRAGIVRSALLVTEWIPGGVSLEKYLWREYGEKSPARGRAARKKFILARRAGELIGRVHAAEIYTQDLSPQNLIVYPSGLEGEIEGSQGSEEPGCREFTLALADLDSVHLWRRLGQKRRNRNLIQAGNLPEGHITWADRLRALKAYAGIEGSHLAPARLRLLREGILREAGRTLRRMLPGPRCP